MAKSDAIAADLLKAAFGPIGATMISVMVAIAALTSINATMIVGARTNFAVGRDWPLLSRLGHWDEGRGTPVTALVWQSVAALVLVAIGALAGGGFKSMVEFTAPVFWFFFLLSGHFPVRAARARAGRAAAVPGPALPAAAARVLPGLRLHAVGEPVLRLQPGTRRAQRGVDRRGVLAIGATLAARDGQAGGRSGLEGRAALSAG